MATSIRTVRALIHEIREERALGDDKRARRATNNLRAVVDALQRGWARQQQAAQLLDEPARTAALRHILDEIDDLKARIAALGDPKLDAAIGGG